MYKDQDHMELFSLLTLLHLPVFLWPSVQLTSLKRAALLYLTLQLPDFNLAATLA